MKKKYFLVIIVFFTVVQAVCQNELKLIAKAYNDTALVESSVNVELTIEGIAVDFELENQAKSTDPFDAFFSGKENDKKFKMFISVTPKKLGKNKFGPYKIKLLGKEIASNEVIIYAYKRKSEEITILMPDEAKLGQEITIKILNYSNADYNVQLKQNDFFEIKNSSLSISNINGKYTRTLSLKVKLLKEGKIILDRSKFKNIPEYVQVKPVRTIVKE